MFRDRGDALDGGTDIKPPLLPNSICTLMKSTSFDAGLHGLEVAAEQRYKAAKASLIWTGAQCEEINRLRNDNEVLKQHITELRDEFRSLKAVLLHTESRRRWQDCVS